jgi:hypothetical protein
LKDDKLNIDLETRLAVNPNLVLRIEDDDCALLFDPDNGSVQLFNQTAVEIWQRLDGRRSLRELIVSLGDVFDAMGPEAESQVLHTVASLLQVGAVVLSEQDK